MNTDPYVALLEAMRKNGAEEAQKHALHLMLATVLTVNPLSLDVCGTLQEAPRIYICSHLMPGYTETVNASGSLQISASCPLGSHSGMSVSSGTLTLKQTQPILKAGDQVVVLTDDDQIFILFDKVVKP